MLIKKRIITDILILIFVLTGLMYMEIEDVKAQEENIKGEAFVTFAEKYTESEAKNQKLPSTTRFTVTMPDGKSYTGWCMDHGRVTPMDGKYEFTGILNDEGSYDITINSNYKAMSILEIHEIDKNNIKPGAMPPFTAQRVGLFKWKPVSKGKAKIVKSAEQDSHLTNLCKENYSLEGAKYEIYKDEALKNSVGIFITDANGFSNEIELEVGDYFIKEIEAPKGYYLDQRIHRITVNENSTTTFSVSDKPHFDPLSLILEKKSKDDRYGKHLLKGAEYTVKYYKNDRLNEGNFRTEKAFREWRFITREMPNGKIGFVMDDSYKIDGDELFKDSSGIPVGLIGTYVVEEIKAPKGFLKAGGIISLQNVTYNHKTSQINLLKDVVDIEVPQTISLILNKVDEQNSSNKAQGYGSLQGAKYDVLLWDVLENSFKNITTLVTDEKGYAIYENGLPGLYKVVEKEPSKGYIIDKKIHEIKAGINDLVSGTFRYVISSKERVTQIEFSKKTFDKYGRKVGLLGAKIQLIDDNGKIIEEFITTGSNKIIKGLEVGRQYTFKEIEAPEGYFKSKDVSFNVGSTGNIQKIEMIDYPKGKVFINKKIIKDNEAEISLLDERNFKDIVFGLFSKEDIVIDGKILYKAGELIYKDALDKDGNFHYDGLRAGKYFVKEISVPRYLNKDDSVYEFYIDYGTNFNIEEKININNEGTKVDILKVDISGESELPGAYIEIREKNGKLVHSFVSKNVATRIEGLERGKTYILKEKIAPKGYVLSNREVEFYVREDGSVSKVYMPNKFVEIKKLDDSGKMLSGARMQILDKYGNVVDEFISSNVAYKASNLIEGEKYILREIDAPKGYEKSEDIEFVVSDYENQVIQMVDKKVRHVVKTGDSRYGYDILISLFFMTFIHIIIMRGKNRKQ